MIRAPTPLLRAVLVLVLLLFSGAGQETARAGPAEDLVEAERLIRHAHWDKKLLGLEILAKQPAGPKQEELGLHALESEDWEVQIHAARTLAKVGAKDAQKALTKLAVEGDIQWVRDAAVEALKDERFDHDRATDVLLHMAKTRKRVVERAHALRAAAPLAKPDHLKRLRSLAKHKDHRVVAAAVVAIGQLLRHADAKEDVLKTLNGYLKYRSASKHFIPYMETIRALGQLDEPDVRATLVDEIVRQEDDDPYMPERVARLFETMQAEGVAASIIKGLTTTKRKEAIVRLVRLAGRIRSRGTRKTVESLLTHKSDRVRTEATRALGLIGDPEAAGAVKRQLQDKSPYVRVEAITAMSRLVQPETFRALAKAIRKDAHPNVRLQYVSDIADQMHEEGLAALKPFLDDESWRVATAAVVSVGTLGTEKQLETVKPFRESKDWKVRGAAYEAFGRLRALASIPMLIEGLDDKDPVVRGVCLSNLQILSRRRLGSKKDLWIRWWEKEGKKHVLKKRSRMSEEEKRRESDATGPDSRYARPSTSVPTTKDEGIKILRKARILVIKGAWDKVEVVLTHLRIPHTPLRAQELKDAGLNPNQIVLVNCEGNMDKKTVERVQWFVNVGGYLMSTDWALTKAVRVAFPGYVQQFAKASTGNDVVVVENGQPNHPLNAGVFDNVPALKWWLEIQAFPITITYPERTTVLVDSAEMRQRYGSSPCAAVFRWGLGKVQHSVSHFYLQEEGMQHLSSGKERKVFAADNLGLSLTQIRKVDLRGGFDGALNDETMKQIAPDYSMFRLIVNMVREKKDWVENL